MAPETEIKWSENSSKNLRCIYNYISADSEFYALRFVTKLVLATEGQLKKFPLVGRKVPEFNESDLDFLRELIFKNYRIIYNPKKAPKQITIIAVLNAKMDIPRHLKKSWF